MTNIIDQFRIDNKIALVTGCLSGIGLAMAVGLAEAGADIIGVSSGMKSEGSEVEKSVLAAGRKFFPYQCDFSNRNSLSAFIKKVTTDF